MSLSKEEILKAISEMSVIEISELILLIEKKFSISIESDKKFLNNEENIENKKNINEKTNFSVFLKSIGDNKISVIKIIRLITNLGLKESKDLVDSCPIIIKENINKEESEKIKKLFENSGAIIEIK